MKRNNSKEISEGGELVLADFPNQISNLPNWHWRNFADTVMGGKSYLVPPEIVDTPEGYALRLTGQVETQGGGFIQIRLQREKEAERGTSFISEQEYNKQYGREDGIFDASQFKGVTVDLKAAQGGSYFIFIRTRDNFFPWSYYASSIDVPAQRGSISIPWSEFTGQSTLRKSIRPRFLRSIAFVAAFKDFTANLYIYRLSLYK